MCCCALRQSLGNQSSIRRTSEHGCGVSTRNRCEALLRNKPAKGPPATEPFIPFTSSLLARASKPHSDSPINRTEIFSSHHRSSPLPVSQACISFPAKKGATPTPNAVYRALKPPVYANLNPDNNHTAYRAPRALPSAPFPYPFPLTPFPTFLPQTSLSKPTNPKIQIKSCPLNLTPRPPIPQT